MFAIKAIYTGFFLKTYEQCCVNFNTVILRYADILLIHIFAGKGAKSRKTKKEVSKPAVKRAVYGKLHCTILIHSLNIYIPRSKYQAGSPARLLIPSVHER